MAPQRRPALSGQEGEAILFKACPRCGGDLHRTRDIYGPYRECLQCGFIQEEAEEPAPSGRGPR